MSDVKMSNVSSHTFTVKCQISAHTLSMSNVNVNCLMSDDTCQMSDHTLPMAYDKWQMADVRCQMSDGKMAKWQNGKMAKWQNGTIEKLKN